MSRPQFACIVLFSFWGVCILIGSLNEPFLHNLMTGVLILSGGYQLVRNSIHLLGYNKYTDQLKVSSSTTVEHVDLPLISILIPAFNEEALIERTLHSVAALQYPSFEIVVIDDGSRDSTVQRVKKFSQNHSVDIRLIQKTNSGKAASLNLGISQARGEFILCMDADSRLQSEGVREAVRRMLKQPDLVALGGVVESDEPQGFLVEQQQMEYLTGNFQKGFLSLFHRLNIVPGPIGLFRKNAVQAVGGYTTEVGSYAEDTELTLRLLAHGGHVAFEPRMRAFTQSPRDWQSLMNQRYRWNRGILQAVFHSLPQLLYNPKRKGHVGFGLYLLSEQVVTLALEFGVFVYFVTKLCSYGEITFLSTYLLCLIAMDTVVAFWALGRRETLPKILYRVITARFSYSIMLLIWRVFALLEEGKATKMCWNKVERYSNSDPIFLPIKEGAHG